MTSKTATDYTDLRHVQRYKQARRAMPHIVVGPGDAATRLHRQPQLGPIQGLKLALLIHTGHQGLVRRVQIQPHHVGQLLHKGRVAGQLEGP